MQQIAEFYFDQTPGLLSVRVNTPQTELQVTAETEVHRMLTCKTLRRF